MKPGIYQQAELSGLSRVSADVCIIGSGCGGATLARRLAAAGLDVLILEQGGYYPPGQMDQDELNMQGKLYGERGLEAGADGGNTLLYANNVGGASVHYWADSYRTPAAKLREWAEVYGVRGHGEAELAPAFAELEANLHIHPAPDELFNPLNHKLRQAAGVLGWQGHRVPQARRHCQRSGHCMQGCIYGAKQDQAVTHIPQAIADGARVFADARAARFERDGAQVRRLHVEVMDRARNRPSGHGFSVEARVFVVAAGGFASAHLLLRQGLARELPALGKHFSMNPSSMVYGLFDEELTQWRNIPAAFGIDEFLDRREADGRYREGGYLLMPNQLHPGALGATLPLKGARLGEWMGQFGRIGGTVSWIDDVETELGEIRQARDGSRRVHYPYGPLTRQVLLDSVYKQVQLLFAMGARQVAIAGHQGITLDSPRDLPRLEALEVAAGGLLLASPHPGGGCRMGEDPAASVVDSGHRVHGFANLFVADSSVFPTSSALDPSLTIMAFSYVAAASIREQFF